MAAVPSEPGPRARALRPGHGGSHVSRLLRHLPPARGPGAQGPLPGHLVSNPGGRKHWVKWSKRIHFRSFLRLWTMISQSWKVRKRFYVSSKIYDTASTRVYFISPARPKHITDGCKTFSTCVINKTGLWKVNNKITGLWLVGDYWWLISRNSNPIMVKVSINIYSDQARDGLGTLSRIHGQPPPYNILPLGNDKKLSGFLLVNSQGSYWSTVVSCFRLLHHRAPGPLSFRLRASSWPHLVIASLLWLWRLLIGQSDTV